MQLKLIMQDVSYKSFLKILIFFFFFSEIVNIPANAVKFSFLASNWPFSQIGNQLRVNVRV
jgi:hypothetical protein